MGLDLGLSRYLIRIVSLNVDIVNIEDLTRVVIFFHMKFMKLAEGSFHKGGVSIRPIS